MSDYKRNSNAIRRNGIVTATLKIPKQPFVTILPIFRSLPLLVNGIPILREIFDFTRDIPIKRFHENPPLFIFPKT